MLYCLLIAFCCVCYLCLQPSSDKARLPEKMFLYVKVGVLFLERAVLCEVTSRTNQKRPNDRTNRTNHPKQNQNNHTNNNRTKQIDHTDDKKQNQRKRNETKRNETKRNETKQNKSNQSETKQKQNSTTRARKQHFAR